jgi:uncharacterized delta-60 repeat protein
MNRFNVFFLLLCAASWVNASTARLDPEFGDQGKVLTTLPFSVRAQANAVAVQSDGKIVVVGGAGDNFLIARYDDKGALDPSFGDQGVVVTRIGPPGAAQAVVQEKSGALLVVGGANGFVAARYDAAGASLGALRTTNNAYWGYGVALLPDDGFVIVGDGGNTGDKCAIARYSFSGELDGQVVVANELRRCRGLAREADGRLVTPVGRDARNGDDIHGFGLARFLENGTLDVSFGVNGTAFSRQDVNALLNAIAQTPDGGYAGAGSLGSGLTALSFLVGKFSSGGFPDARFGEGGTSVVGVGNGIGFKANAVAVQPGGEIIAGGVVRIPGNVKDGQGPGLFALARFTSNGAVDPSFGQPELAGLLIDGFGTGSTAEILAMTLQPDGKLLVAGKSELNQSQSIALARYILSPPAAAAEAVDLSVKLKAPKKGKSGKAVKYVATASNASNTSANQVSLTIQLSTGAVFSKIPSYCAASGQSLVCALGRLAGKQRRSFGFAAIPASKGALTAAATIASDAPDSNAANNIAQASTAVK